MVYGVQVITSFHPEGAEDHLLVIASTTLPQEEGMPSTLRVQIPRSKAYFTGTGDCLESTKFNAGNRHNLAQEQAVAIFKQNM